jgi:hypothetical protein
MLAVTPVLKFANQTLVLAREREVQSTFKAAFRSISIGISYFSWYVFLLTSLPAKV